MVDFGGWDMPLNYAPGILQEHLATRKCGGLFDVSHMGRFRIAGANKVAFLQHVLSCNVSARSPWQAQYAPSGRMPKNNLPARQSKTKSGLLKYSAASRLAMFSE